MQLYQGLAAILQCASPPPLLHPCLDRQDYWPQGQVLITSKLMSNRSPWCTREVCRQSRACLMRPKPLIRRPVTTGSMRNQVKSPGRDSVLGLG